MALGLDIKYLLDIDLWGNYGFTDTKNIDSKKLRPIIVSVQQTRLRKILGTNLYNKLCTDTPTFTGLYETLMKEHVLMYMIACCDYEYTFHGTYQLTNKGAGKLNDQNINANSTEDNNDLRDNFAKIISERERAMIGWLKDNWDDIPELVDSIPTDSCHEYIQPAKKVNKPWTIL